MCLVARLTMNFSIASRQPDITLYLQWLFLFWTLYLSDPVLNYCTLSALFLWWRFGNRLIFGKERHYNKSHLLLQTLQLTTSTNA
jgi:hypothetical protein